jgi:hypothetical protein
MIPTINAVMEQYGRKPLPMQNDPAMNAALRAHQGTQKLIQPDAREKLGIPAQNPPPKTPAAGAGRPNYTPPKAAAPVQDAGMQQGPNPVRDMLAAYGIKVNQPDVNQHRSYPQVPVTPQQQLQGLQQLEQQLAKPSNFQLVPPKRSQFREVDLAQVREMIRQLQAQLQQGRK